MIDEKSRKVNGNQIDILKPCPFCGSDAKMCDGYSHHYVRCSAEDCLVRTRRFKDVTDAIRCWNRRVRE